MKNIVFCIMVGFIFIAKSIAANPITLGISKSNLQIISVPKIGEFHLSDQKFDRWENANSFCQNENNVQYGSGIAHYTHIHDLLEKFHAEANKKRYEALLLIKNVFYSNSSFPIFWPDREFRAENKRGNQKLDLAKFDGHNPKKPLPLAWGQKDYISLASAQTIGSDHVSRPVLCYREFGAVSEEEYARRARKSLGDRYIERRGPKGFPPVIIKKN